MQGSFKSKKQFAIVIAAVSGLSILYSLFFSKSEPTLKQEIGITDRKPELKSAKPSKGSEYYWVEFHFINHYDSAYKLPGKVLKYTLYHELMRDTDTYDTLVIKSDENYFLYSIVLDGKSYVDEAKVLQSDKDYYSFLIFIRVIICFACLPILFFRKQPIFFHSGFEFEFSFAFLFVVIVAISACIYFYYNGTDYLFAVDPTTLR